MELLRVCLWVAFSEIFSHLVFFNTISQEKDIPWTISRWALVGVGYLKGQFFQVKHMVYWRFAGVFGQLDQLTTPPPPRCVATIHLYSKMLK